MERQSERSGPSEAPSTIGEANGAETVKPGAQNGLAPEEPQPAYDWQAAFQVKFSKLQHHLELRYCEKAFVPTQHEKWKKWECLGHHSIRVGFSYLILIQMVPSVLGRVFKLPL
jgi:hypothetical protein